MKFIKANVNIALLKYWGKVDQKLNLPYQTSISVTASIFFTRTNVRFDNTLSYDKVSLDGNDLTGLSYSRVVSHLDTLRAYFKRTEFCEVTSFNNVYIRAGYASSASAFAALTAAYAKEAGENLSEEELSKLSRLGSGSAARSIHGGFTIWNKGDSHDTSFATKLNVDWPEFRLLFTVIDQTQKTISSRIGMQLSVEKSPSYLSFVRQSEEMVEPMKEAILKKDINAVGVLSERSADLMHNVMVEAGLEYQTPVTKKLIQDIKAIREKYNIPVYYTFDAGPNLILLTLDNYIVQITNYLPNIKTLTSTIGGPISEVSE